MNIIRFKEDVIYDRIADQVIRLCESGRFDEAESYLFSLNERALFGSMKSQKKKLAKKIIDLKSKIMKVGNLNDENATKVFKDFALAAKELEAVLASPTCDAVFKAIDDNTGWFGRDKGKFGNKSGITSTKFQVSENKEVLLKALRENEEVATDNPSTPKDDLDNKSEADLIKMWMQTKLGAAMQKFSTATKNLEQYGVKTGHPLLKSIATYAGPVLMAGSMLAMMIPGGQAIGLGMRAVGGACTAISSGIGATKSLAKGDYLGAGLKAGGALAGGLVAGNALGGLGSMAANAATGMTTNATAAGLETTDTPSVEGTVPQDVVPADTIENSIVAQSKAHPGDIVNGKVLTQGDITAAINQVKANGGVAWTSDQFGVRPMAPAPTAVASATPTQAPFEYTTLPDTAPTATVATTGQGITFPSNALDGQPLDTNNLKFPGVGQDNLFAPHPGNTVPNALPTESAIASTPAATTPAAGITANDIKTNPSLNSEYQKFLRSNGYSAGEDNISLRNRFATNYNRVHPVNTSVPDVAPAEVPTMTSSEWKNYVAQHPEWRSGFQSTASSPYGENGTMISGNGKPLYNIIPDGETWQPYIPRS